MRLWRPRLAPRWSGPFAPSLIALSFGLNVTALVLPFMDLRRGLSTQPYSLPASVRFLWESGLYVLAAVVVAFSILFPFLKLGAMALVLLGAVGVERERRVLELLLRWGKWSMLDVFLVLIMLALANDQFWIDAQPRAGLLCFTLAIVASMVTSKSMLERATAGEEQEPARFRHPRWLAAGQAALVALFVGVLVTPFLEIDDWLLEDHPVSILSATLSLWQSGARPLAGVALAFLVVAPLAAGLGTLAIFLRAGQGRRVDALRRVAQELRHWSMLDVFALALGIFLVEGKEFVRTDLTWGAFLLALLLALYWPLSSLTERRI